MRRQDDDAAAERKLLIGFAAAGMLLFAGTLMVGFSERDLRHHVSPPAISVTATADSAG